MLRGGERVPRRGPPGPPHHLRVRRRTPAAADTRRGGCGRELVLLRASGACVGVVWCIELVPLGGCGEERHAGSRRDHLGGILQPPEPLLRVRVPDGDGDVVQVVVVQGTTRGRRRAVKEERLRVHLELHVHPRGCGILRDGLVSEGVDGVDWNACHRLDRGEVIDGPDDVERHDEGRDLAQQAHQPTRGTPRGRHRRQDGGVKTRIRPSTSPGNLRLDVGEDAQGCRLVHHGWLTGPILKCAEWRDRRQSTRSPSGCAHQRDGPELFLPNGTICEIPTFLSRPFLGLAVSKSPFG